MRPPHVKYLLRPEWKPPIIRGKNQDVDDMNTFLRWIAIGGVACMPTAAFSQFNYTVNGNSITITGYTGSGGVVSIPADITFVSGYDTNDNPIYTTLPVTSIGPGAFELNTALTSITIPDTVTSIQGVNAYGYGVFFGCTNLTSVHIGNSVSFIGEAAFDDTGLTSLTIPNSVTSIGEYAFSQCFYLSSVTIPNSVTNIGSDAFYDCPALTSVSIENAIITDGEFENTGLTNIMLPVGITSIGAEAFSGCLHLTKVIISNGVTNIGEGAFDECVSLSNVIWPNSVVSIANYVFDYCTNLTNITIPNYVTSIGEAAFQRCTSLTNIVIPSSVTNIGDAAFLQCSSLATVFCKGNAPSADSTVFSFSSGADPSTTYYLPGTVGWGANFGGRPAVLWNPSVQTKANNFGVRTNKFGFTINGTANIPITVTASTNFASGVWTNIQSCTLTNGSIYFSDPAWTNFPRRFYSVAFP